MKWGTKATDAVKGFSLAHLGIVCVALIVPLCHMSCVPEPQLPPELWHMEMSTDRDTFSSGETVRAQISLTNVYPKAYMLRPSPPMVKVQEVYTSEVVAVFPGTEEEGVLEPGETLTWYVSWDQSDREGHQVHPGRYTFHLEFTTVLNARVTHHGAPGSIVKIGTAED